MAETNGVKKMSAKEVLTMISLILSLLFNGAAVFGGMKWITEVNQTLFESAKATKGVVEAVSSLEKWKIKINERHAIEDALETQRQSATRVQRRAPHQTGEVD